MQNVWNKVIDAEFIELEQDEFVQEINPYKKSVFEKILDFVSDVFNAYKELWSNIKWFLKQTYKKHSTLICFLIWVCFLYAFRITGSWIVSRIPLDV